MRKYAIFLILALLLILQGCSEKDENKTQSLEETMKQEKEVDVTQVTQAAPTPTVAVVEEIPVTVTPVPVELVLPVTTNDTGKVLIQTVTAGQSYPYNSYIITSIDGESVVIDATTMPKPEVVDIKPVAMLQTHTHPDHSDSEYTASYDVPKLMSQKGELTVGDFHMYTIPSSHSNDTIVEDGGNVIVVVEVDGLRIAHMGDVGQTKLTEDQLDQIGTIDIAFMQFENRYSDMSLQNEKGFTMIEQLNPTIVIPTHYTDKALETLEEKYGAITELENILEISKENLPENALNVYRILNTHKYK
jgi:L-ascorbate metabolism protein UlaG (beta-lactamase superfamily)